MFGIVVKLKNDDWLDITGVSDVELSKALSDWSSGKEDTIEIKGFLFGSKDIVSILVHR